MARCHPPTHDRRPLRRRQIHRHPQIRRRLFRAFGKRDYFLSERSRMAAQAPMRARVHQHTRQPPGTVASVQIDSLALMQTQLFGLSQVQARTGIKQAAVRTCTCIYKHKRSTEKILLPSWSASSAVVSCAIVMHTFRDPVGFVKQLRINL
jgi:hypothetical protein